MKKILFKNINNLIVQSSSKQYLVGEDFKKLEVLNNAYLLFDSKILFYGSNNEYQEYKIKNNIITDQEYDLTGKTVLPGFVDSHTHIVYGGDRSSDFVQRSRGVTYDEIAKAGGGIQTTVNHTRSDSHQVLYDRALKHINNAMRYGTTSIEIKSGYSLNIEGEIKQLEVINQLKKDLDMNIIPTFMGAHDFPPELKNDREKYLDILCNEMLPEVKHRNLSNICDVFIDEGYFTVEQGVKVLQKAKDLGFEVKAHCDELVDTNSTFAIAELGAISCDHLLNVNENGINSLKENGTVAGLLPGTAYFIRKNFAPARKIIDNDVITCLATDCNPGSCYTENIQLIMSFGLTNMYMSVEEVINAATINGAYSLRLSDRVGSISKGKDADILVFDSNNYINILYHFGVNNIEQTWIKGRIAYQR